MLKGEVNSRRIAVVLLRLRGADQAETEVEVMLDTGFSAQSALNYTLIDSLGWPRRDTTEVILADGSSIMVNVYEGRVWWDHEWKKIYVQAAGECLFLAWGCCTTTLSRLKLLTAAK